jgi:hypothetical protein
LAQNVPPAFLYLFSFQIRPANTAYLSVIQRKNQQNGRKNKAKLNYLQISLKKLFDPGFSQIITLWGLYFGLKLQKTASFYLFPVFGHHYKYELEEKSSERNLHKEPPILVLPFQPHSTLLIRAGLHRASCFYARF